MWSAYKFYRQKLCCCFLPALSIIFIGKTFILWSAKVKRSYTVYMHMRIEKKPKLLPIIINSAVTYLLCWTGLRQFIGSVNLFSAKTSQGLVEVIRSVAIRVHFCNICFCFGQCNSQIKFKPVTKYTHQLIYRKVASSRPVSYSILNHFVQWSQYISIKVPLNKQSENMKMCY